MAANRRLTIGLRLMTAAAILTASCSARAEESTEIQRRACKPDVYRLCKWYIPSHAAITYCLQQNIDKLSPECRAVMEGRLR